MKAIIVTVTDESGKMLYDIEVPNTQPTAKLLPDIIEALAMQPDFPALSAEKAELVDLRMQTVLPENQTFFESGVLNGDYIMLRRKHGNG